MVGIRLNPESALRGKPLLCTGQATDGCRALVCKPPQVRPGAAVSDSSFCRYVAYPVHGEESTGPLLHKHIGRTRLKNDYPAREAVLVRRTRWIARDVACRSRASRREARLAWGGDGHRLQAVAFAWTEVHAKASSPAGGSCAAQQTEPFLQGWDLRARSSPLGPPPSKAERGG